MKQTKLMLTKEDITALTLEVKINTLIRILSRYSYIMTHAQRNTIHNQTMKLVSEQLNILYKNGEYREDKRHLLVPNASHLNVKLLKELKCK